MIISYLFRSICISRSFLLLCKLPLFFIISLSMVYIIYL
nr:MAG TPA: hypothetical protein [Bacteriophage sp.]